MMDNDRPLAPGRPGAELTSMTVAPEHPGAKTGEVALVPLLTGVATGTEPCDQLPSPPQTRHQKALCRRRSEGFWSRGAASNIVRASERQVLSRQDRNSRSGSIWWPQSIRQEDQDDSRSTIYGLTGRGTVTPDEVMRLPLPKQVLVMAGGVIYARAITFLSGVKPMDDNTAASTLRGTIYRTICTRPRAVHGPCTAGMDGPTSQF